MNDGTITGDGVTGAGDVDGVVNLTSTGTIRSLDALSDFSETGAENDTVNNSGQMITAIGPSTSAPTPPGTPPPAAR